MDLRLFSKSNFDLKFILSQWECAVMPNGEESILSVPADGVFVFLACVEVNLSTLF